MKSLIVIWSCALVTLSGQAPKFSNDFLNIGVGARAMAMAGSATASTSSVQAAYWNPGLLPFNPSKFQVSAQHAEWFSGLGNYDYVAFGKRLDENSTSFGSISLIRMAIDKIPNTLRLRGPDGSIDYSRIEEFSVSDYAFMVSFGKKLASGKWAFGLNAKVIHRNFGNFANAWGFGFDAALHYQSSKLGLSVMARDITTSFNAYRFTFSDEEKAILQQTNNDIPVSSVEYTLPRLVTGLCYVFRLGSKVHLLSEINLELSTNGTESSLVSKNKFNIDPRMGIELDIANKVYLRGGLGNFQKILKVDGSSDKELSYNPSAGLGIHFGKITIDYAMSNIGSKGVGLYSHFFSINLDF